MGTQYHGDPFKTRCEGHNNLPYRTVADRVQEWNRAIPEAGYVTLGTIRYGVRLSTGTHPVGVTDNKTISSLGQGSCQIDLGTEESVCGSSSSNQSTNFKSCCCIGPSGLNLPWNTSYSRTRFPMPTSYAKNRTSSTSQAPQPIATSSHLLLTQSTASTYRATPVIRTSGCSSSPGSKTASTQSQVVVAGMDHSQAHMRSPRIHASKPQSHLQTLPMVSSTSAPKIVSSVPMEISTAKCTNRNIPHLEGSSSSTDSILRRRRSISESFTGTCEDNFCESNSASVSIGPRREVSLSPPKATSSICCYTIAYNSPKSFLKQPNPNPANSKLQFENCESLTISNSTNNNKTHINNNINNRSYNDNKCENKVKDSSINSDISCNFHVRDEISESFCDQDRHAQEKSNELPDREHSIGSVDSLDFRQNTEKQLRRDCNTLQIGVKENSTRCEFLNCFSGGSTFNSSDGNVPKLKSNENSIKKTVPYEYKPISNSKNYHIKHPRRGIHDTHEQEYNNSRFAGNGNGNGKSDLSDYEKKNTNDHPFKGVVVRKITPKLSTGYIQFENDYIASNSIEKSASENDLNFDLAITNDLKVSSTGSMYDRLNYKQDGSIVDNDSDIGYIDASADGDSLSFVSGDYELQSTDTDVDTDKVNPSTEKVSTNVQYCYNDIDSSDYGNKEYLCSINECDENSVLCSQRSNDNNSYNRGIHIKTKRVQNSPITSRSYPLVQPSPINYFGVKPPTTSKYKIQPKVRLTRSGLVSVIENNSSSVQQNFFPELIMERRRLNLDRWQRLGFGKKSSSNSSKQDTKNQSRKASEKSERLKELTELLKGNRSSPTPPPIPPPRRPRQPGKTEKQPSVDSGLSAKSVSDDIILMDADDEISLEPLNRNSDDISYLTESHDVTSLVGTPQVHHKRSLYEELKPHTSISNLEQIIMDKEKRDRPSISPLKEDELFTKIPRAESRTIVGSYTQKSIPFRSASFSQIDYSSGKYIKSALSAIRDKLRGGKSSIDNTNLTLPRKKPDFRSSSPRLHANEEETCSSHSPRQLKKSELTINLKYDPDNERPSLEEIVNPPDVILEEESPSPEFDRRQDFALMESNFVNTPSVDCISQENLIGMEKIRPDVVIDSELLETLPEKENSNHNLGTNEVNCVPLSEPLGPNLIAIGDDEVSLESQTENLMRTASSCLIPVPVYECGGQEWNPTNTPDLWLDVAQDEMSICPDILGLSNESFVCKASDTNLIAAPQVNVAQNTIPGETDGIHGHTVNENIPIIEVISESKPIENTDQFSETFIEKELGRELEKQLGIRCDDSVDVLGLEEKGLDDKQTEFVEVKKRNSNNEGKTCDSMEALISGSYNTEEKRRIDKSKRRKGVYIQWAAIDKHGDLEPSNWGSETDCRNSDDFLEHDSNLDLSRVDFSAMNMDSADSIDPATLFLSCKVTGEPQLPLSQHSVDTSTPESDGVRPSWPKGNRRTSLTCQSSEEKDDAPSTMSPALKSHRNLMLTRYDSISDNESDRSFINRDRTSPSPVPSDQDLKRYSKRPLRGPYGQMLEAEMKKPGKVQYDELLEELKNSESLNQLSVPVINRQSVNHSFEDSTDTHDTSSNNESQKAVGHLPIPVHTRAASTPSQMENVTTITSLNTQHKRYQSNVDNTSTDVNRQKDTKKFTVEQDQGKATKHHSSEFERKHSAKRSASTASEKQPKRSLDENKLDQCGRTPSERSIANSGSQRESGKNLIPSQELLAELLKGSSERLVSEQRQKVFADTRTHVVQEIYRNEQSYVESLQTVVYKYMNVLKSPEYAGMIDTRAVDEIFFMVPEILSIHEKFLTELRARLDTWDLQQKVGDSFIETFSKAEVLETYTSFVNNCNKAKSTIKTMTQTRPSFARFLEAMSREHKGKLPLDNLLIKPVQKFPNYEMLFTRLIKHTEIDHPDQKPLQEVLKLVHDILVHINCKEKELLENGQREATLRDLEGVIEGISDLVTPERQFLLFDLVSMPAGQGARKERGLFLFNDLLVITSIKRRSGTIRKPNTSTCPGSVAATLDTNKYKFLTKISLDNLDIVKSKYFYKQNYSVYRRKYRILDTASQVQPKLPTFNGAKDENFRKIMNEIEQLADDCSKLQQIADIAASLRYPHTALDETVRDLQREVQRQLYERQSNDTQLSMLELTVNSSNGMQNLSIVFCKPEKRSHWEETFNEAKQKLVASLERYPVPEFLSSIPIRKTRAGLQFTCAAPTISTQKDVWVCNSDGYVGQVCVLSLTPEPTVTSCNGVCNARILCVASVPAVDETNETNNRNSSSSTEQTPRHSRNSNSSSQGHTNSNERKIVMNKVNSNGSDMQLDSNSSSDESDAEDGNLNRIPSPPASSTAKHSHQDSNSEESDVHQSTMWLGTEDGCIHVYNCNDNIRIKKNKIKIQLVSAVFSILYLDNRVFVSLANGDICVYIRDNGGWNTNSPHCLSIGTVTGPVNRLLNVHGKLWCSIQGIIKVLNTKTFQVEHQIQISSDSKPITNMALSNNSVWVSIQNSAHIKCFHSTSYELVFEVNLAPSVNKMLSTCDDIIRQHKAACLRVTSLLACKDLIWIGTSAGVLLTIPSQGCNSKGQSNNIPVVTGIPHGHTGHVRFLTFVETNVNGCDGHVIEERTALSSNSSNRCSGNISTKSENGAILIISGGDGYEDFRSSGVNTMSEVAGREDSTNHLLLWQM